MNDDLEPEGGNLYRPHRLLSGHGTFWRCQHGNTGIAGSLHWTGCWRCAARNPLEYLAWKFRGETT